MVENETTVKGSSLWSDAWKRLLKNKLAVFGLIVLVIMLVTVLIGPPLIKALTGLTADYIPADGDLIKSFPPSLQHPFGTDEAGRDLLARVLQGGRISLMVGLISTIVSLIVGVSYGATAGYLAGRIDNFMMRIVDIIYAIPYILIVIVLLNVFGGNNTAVLVGWLPQILASLSIFAAGSILAVIAFRRIFEHREIEGIAFGLLKALFIVAAVLC